MHPQTKVEIALVMQNKGISKYKMAKDLGIRESRIGEFFSGKTSTSKHETAILEYLGIGVEQKIVVI